MRRLITALAAIVILAPVLLATGESAARWYDFTAWGSSHTGPYTMVEFDLDTGRFEDFTPSFSDRGRCEAIDAPAD